MFMVQQTRKFYAVGFLFISPLLPKFLHDNGFFLQQGVIKWVIWVNKREKARADCFISRRIWEDLRRVLLLLGLRKHKSQQCEKVERPQVSARVIRIKSAFKSKTSCVGPKNNQEPAPLIRE